MTTTETKPTTTVIKQESALISSLPPGTTITVVAGPDFVETIGGVWAHTGDGVTDDYINYCNGYSHMFDWSADPRKT